MGKEGEWGLEEGNALGLRKEELFERVEMS